ncbi:hypothetical protein M427DRAFT_28835 [Gonapodya prolifera JEL478]|uniref:BZIP domain-containing protein n=1 Tax=Gonapodya prolifera (strain JEL478) TaxID=1344416 RepID=A0A139ATC6_GONPJ|nr:hypothetical protein M427DRAFT_28835 [Gonapodya prolifera JEL478]|eukprot:KXS19976.1 hypothetical protein M427DRAFT_28835 [Gonapodya prolifera JEL478]
MDSFHLDAYLDVSALDLNSIDINGSDLTTLGGDSFLAHGSSGNDPHAIGSASDDDTTSPNAGANADFMKWSNDVDVDPLPDFLDFPILDVDVDGSDHMNMHMNMGMGMDMNMGMNMHGHGAHDIAIDLMDADESEWHSTAHAQSQSQGQQIQATVVSLNDLLPSTHAHLSSSLSPSLSPALLPSPASITNAYSGHAAADPYSPPSPSESGDSTSSSSNGSSDTLVDDPPYAPPSKAGATIRTTNISAMSSSPTSTFTSISASGSASSTNSSKRQRTNRATTSKPAAKPSPSSTHPRLPLPASIPLSIPVSIPLPASLAQLTSSSPFTITIAPPTLNPANLPRTLVQGSDLAAETMRIIQGPEKKKPGRKKKASPTSSSATATGAPAAGASLTAVPNTPNTANRKRKSPPSAASDAEDDDADNSGAEDFDFESVSGSAHIKSEPRESTPLSSSGASSEAPFIPPARLDPSLLHNPNFDRRLLDLDPATLPPADRKILRLLKNRASATLSRARRREKLAGLEQASVKLVEENVALKQCVRGLEDEVRRCRAEVERVTRENARLRGALGARPGGADAVAQAIQGAGVGRKRGAGATGADAQVNKAAVLFAVTLLGVAFLWGGLGEVARMSWGGGAGHGSHHLAQVVSTSPVLFKDSNSPVAPSPARILELDPAVIELGPAPSSGEPLGKVDDTIPVTSPPVVVDVGDPPAACPASGSSGGSGSGSGGHISYRNITDMFARCEKASGDVLIKMEVDADVDGKAVMVAGADERILPLPTTPPTQLRLSTQPPFHLAPDAFLFADSVTTLTPLASPGPFPPVRPEHGGRPRMQLVAPAAEMGGKGVVGAGVGAAPGVGKKFVVIDFEVLGARVVGV